MNLRIDDGKSYLGRILFDDIAETYGTPFYLYDLETVNERIRKIRRTFGSEIELYYAVKANSNLELLRAMRPGLDGLDISSVGEMEQGLLSGYESREMSFAGPGKNESELDRALKEGVGIISVESKRELEAICSSASRCDVRPCVALRVNPTLFIKEFAIKMGGAPTQFGIDEEEIDDAIAYMKKHAGTLQLQGIHVYAGTQCMSGEAISRNMVYTFQLAAALREKHGIDWDWINLGGGFGVAYYGEDAELDLGPVAASLKEALREYCGGRGRKPRVIIELGRYLVAEGGLYVARVVSEKGSRGEMFYVLDGGMNHHLAASGNLGSVLRKNYALMNLSNPDGEKEKCNLVGPLCTPLDLMGKGVAVEKPKVGDLIAFFNSGSYAFTSSPLLFLGHETPVELLLSDDDLRVIRNRRKLTDFND